MPEIPYILITFENSTGYYLLLDKASAYGIGGGSYDNDLPPVNLMVPYSIYQCALDVGILWESGGSLRYFILEDGKNETPVEGVTTSFQLNFNYSLDLGNTCSHSFDGRNKDGYDLPDPPNKDIQGDVSKISWTLSQK